MISDVLPFGRLWYGDPNAVSNAIGYAMHSSPLATALIRICDDSGNVIETHEHKGRVVSFLTRKLSTSLTCFE